MFREAVSFGISPTPLVLLLVALSGRDESLELVATVDVFLLAGRSIVPILALNAPWKSM